MSVRFCTLRVKNEGKDFYLRKDKEERRAINSAGKTMCQTHSYLLSTEPIKQILNKYLLNR